MVIITKLFNLLKTSHKEEATCVLLDLLISSTISAAACVPDYDMTKALDAEYWRGLTNEEIELVFRTGKPPKINWFGAVTLVDDWSIDLLPPAQNIGPSSETIMPDVGAKRGRQPSIDWQVVWAGIILIVHRRGTCPHQEELMTEVAAWCDENFGEGTAPSESILKENLRCLYQIINGEDPAKVFPKGTRPTRKRPVKKRLKAK